MPVIDENAAWQILGRYVEDCLRVDAATLLAVYAIGSLPGGYYRPGQSDIDAVLIVADGSEGIWGTSSVLSLSSEEPSQALSALNKRYLEAYHIPKDFGPFPVQERELRPPYDPAKGLCTEIARLKRQGRCVYGRYNLGSVPMPAAEDYLCDARAFEAWWRDEFARATPLGAMTAAACASTVLMHLSRYLRIVQGVLEFDKRRLIGAYLQHNPPVVDDVAFQLVGRALRCEPLSKGELEDLQRRTGAVRSQMNAFLGISV